MIKIPQLSFSSIMSALFIFFIVLVQQLIRRILTEYIPLIIIRPSSKEKQLAATLKEQKHELSQINAQHEFARYAKLKRLCDKCENELRKEGIHRRKQSLKIKGFFWSVGILFLICCHIWVVWKYRSVIIAQLPKQWLPLFHRILRYPNSVDGAIGLPVWLAICNSVVLQLQVLLT